MKKLTALLLCLALLFGLCAAGNAEAGTEQAAKEAEAIAEWEKEYGESLLWDYRVNAAFAAAHTQQPSLRLCAARATALFFAVTAHSAVALR